jgi:glycosyltransferase involved in cell wall biosynthesis
VKLLQVLYIHQYFNTPEMPGGTRSYEMARRLVAVGHDVHVITSQRELDRQTVNKWRVTEIDGIYVHWFPVRYSNKMSYKRRMWAFLHFAWVAGRRARKIGGDVVFATSTPLTVAFPGTYVSKALKIPMVFEVRDLWPELPIATGVLRNPFLIRLARRFEHFAYFHSTHVVALSPGMKAGIVKSGYPESQISVIPNGCDNSLFGNTDVDGKTFLTQYLPSVEGPIVTYAGALGVINGVGYLVDIAAAMLKLDPSVRFVIIGTGKEEENIRAKARKLGVLKQNLWMLPRMLKQDMPKVLSASTLATSLFIDLPEMWNNSANKFFDALAAGCPVMINYQGWQAELLRKTGSGLTVPARDPEDAARKLHDFLQDKSRLAKAGKAARNLAEEEFDRDKLARKLLTVLERAVQDRRSG